VTFAPVGVVRPRCTIVDDEREHTMTTNGFEQLHEGHEAFRTAVERLRTTAERVDEVGIVDLRSLVAADRRFLMEHLLPHAVAEEDVLYPAVQGVLASRRATVGMEEDHRHIERLTMEVGEIEAALGTATAVDPDLAHRVRRVFYSLYALVLNHFEKEEHLYVPYLAAAMTPEKAAELTERFDAAEARHHLPHVPMLP
jgi:iron-sulfur cluster repair protein YtfE (RIC family)